MFQRYREIQMRRQDGETESGFTLIELLIVIVVLGILAAIVVFSLSGVSGESKAAACTSDGKTVEIAADANQSQQQSGGLPRQHEPADAAVPALVANWQRRLLVQPGHGQQQVDVLIGTATSGPAYDANTGCKSLGS